jgi:plastocyanin
MRFLGSALAVSAIVLGACGGGAEKKADSAAAPAAQEPAPAAPAAAGAPAPITGQTVEVKMLGDASGNYKFDPASVTIKAGDGIKFINVSGGPHNIAFDPATIPADVKPQLSANMPNQQGELSSPMFMNPNEAYTISFGNIKPGTYTIHCTPHLAFNMKMTVTVQ